MHILKKITSDHLREAESIADRPGELNLAELPGPSATRTGTTYNDGGMSASNVHICRRVSPVATATLSQARRRHVCGIYELGLTFALMFSSLLLKLSNTVIITM